MQERLQKVLAAAGIASRREAEKIILAGRVTVNGVVADILGSKADPAVDRIALDGKPLSLRPGHRYLILNKPAGYITTMKDPEGRPLVSDLLTGVTERLFPVGRLDYNTEGLLLLTNDGDWANKLAHPRHAIEKEYHVRIRGDATPEQLARFTAGVPIDDRPAVALQASLLKSSGSNCWISVTVTEGRYRLVRRMCEAVGLQVVRLRRVRYGDLKLGELPPGQFRDLTAAEVRAVGGEAPPEKSPPAKKASEKRPLAKKLPPKNQGGRTTTSKRSR
jgi:23S rRNA pseudouridine2605 synthase